MTAKPHTANESPLNFSPNPHTRLNPANILSDRITPA